MCVHDSCLIRIYTQGQHHVSQRRLEIYCTINRVASQKLHVLLGCSKTKALTSMVKPHQMTLPALNISREQVNLCIKYSYPTPSPSLLHRQRKPRTWPWSDYVATTSPKILPYAIFTRPRISNNSLGVQKYARLLHLPRSLSPPLSTTIYLAIRIRLQFIII